MNDAWLDDLRSADWQKRRQAIERLAQQPPDTLRQGLITLLRTQHQDINALNAALQLIARVGEALLQPLVALLDDPDPEVRLYAAQALGLLKSPQALSPLLEHVHDPDPRVRFHILEALALLQTPATREVFLQVLASSAPQDLYFAALEGLARLHDPTLIPHLAPYLDHADLTLQVAEALGQTQTPLALLPLIQRGLWDLFWPTYAALAQVLQATPAAERLPALAVDQVPASAWPALLAALRAEEAEAQQAALPLLASLARRQPDLKGPIIETLLAFWRNPALTEATEPLLADLGDRHLATTFLDALKDAPPPLAASAARLLGRWRVSQAFAPLRHALEHEAGEVGAAAAQALGQLGDLRATDALLDALAHPDSTVAQAALAALLTLRPPSLAADLRVRLEDPHPQVRALALQGLARLDPQQALDDLIAALEDPHPQVQRAAVQALGAHPAPQARAALLERLAHGFPELQATILSALTGRFTPAERPYLLESLRHPLPWVRLHACQALRHLPADPTTQEMLLVLLDDPFPPVRANALRALASTPSVALADRAAAFLQAEEPDLRLAATEALAACDTPQAVQHLREALAHWPTLEKPFLWRALARMHTPQAQATLQEALADPQHTPAVLQALVEAPTPATLPLLVQALGQPRWRALARRGWLRHPPLQAWAALEAAVRRAPPDLAPALLAEARFLPPTVAKSSLVRLVHAHPHLYDAACLVWRAWEQALPPEAPSTPNCLFWSTPR